MAPTNAASQQQQKQHAKHRSSNTKGRVQRYLKSTEPALREGAKSTLLLKGIRCSQGMALLLAELRAVQAPHAKLLGRKNQIVPFDGDGQGSLEFLATKNDCTLIAVGTHNKKRPNHLVVARCFDRQMLDMAELSILKFKSMKDYGGSIPKKRIGSKPMLLFVGEVWQSNNDFRQLQNLMVDFYRGDVIDKLVVSGLDHIIVFTAAAASSSSSSSEHGTFIHQRTYFCKLKKGDNSTAPVPHLTPCGPDFDFQLKRTQWAEPDLYKAARQQPKALKKRSTKNQSTNLFGETLGRLHITKQKVDQRQGRKVKALRRAEKLQAEQELEALEGELQREEREMDRDVVLDE